MVALLVLSKMTARDEDGVLPDIWDWVVGD
jgi:hypothetical protein